MRDAITNNGGTTSAVIVAARVEQLVRVAAVADPNSTAPEAGGAGESDGEGRGIGQPHNTPPIKVLSVSRLFYNTEVKY